MVSIMLGFIMTNDLNEYMNRPISILGLYQFIKPISWSLQSIYI